jgi:ATP-dependent Clp protease ATP-binding subunit ClpB
VGSPPGYLGHRESRPVLSQEALNRYNTPSLKLSLVLFDEIEKASDGLWNLLLGILDKGVLTLGNNRKVDFSRTLSFMTSSLGARQIGALASRTIGFSSGRIARRDSDAVDRAAWIGIEAARRKFTPEFTNRIDHFVTFSTLGRGNWSKFSILNCTSFRRESRPHRERLCLYSHYRRRRRASCCVKARKLNMERGT